LHVEPRLFSKVSAMAEGGCRGFGLLLSLSPRRDRFLPELSEVVLTSKSVSKRAKAKVTT